MLCGAMSGEMDWGLHCACPVVPLRRVVEGVSREAVKRRVFPLDALPISGSGAGAEFVLPDHTSKLHV